MKLEHSSDTVSISNGAVNFSTGLHYGTIIMDDLINEGGEKDMMGLYEVIAVDTKKGVKLLHSDVVATDGDKAKMKVAFGFEKEVPEHVEFFVRCIGQWESRKPKEVRIVKED